MYLHIGKDYVLDERKIIGIFNINTIKQNNYNNSKNKFIDISEGAQKTFILVDDKKINGYITNISSITLKNR